MTAAPASRNAPCPCGSGRRYKDCHGALGAPAARPAPEPPRRRAYRPDGPEWRGLDEARQEQLAGLMEEALALQNAGDDRGASARYRRVLEAAPETHDALHMLGVARWRMGDLADAATLIDRALRQREPYPAIVRNLDSVRRARASRTQLGVQWLSEAALPDLMDTLACGDDRWHAAAREPLRPGEPLHLVLGSARTDGDVVRAFDRLRTLLAPWRPIAWRADATQGDPALRRYDPVSQDGPPDGVHVHVGIDHPSPEVYELFDRGRPRRAVVLPVHASASDWLLRVRRIAQDGAVPVFAAFVAQGQARKLGTDGPVLPSLVDVGPAGREDTVRDGPLRVGVVVTDDGLSRSDALPALALAERRGKLATELARTGAEVVIRDPGRLRYVVGDRPGLRFESRRERTLDAFVRDVDAIVVPSQPWASEGMGEEIFVARAAGVPVVLSASSIHAPEAGTPGLALAHDDAAMVARIAEMVGAGREAVRVPPEARPARLPDAALADVIAGHLALGPKEARR